MYIIIAFITGGFIIVSMIINANLAKKVGKMQGTVINYAVGFAFSIPLFFLLGKKELINADYIIDLPKFYLFGGVLGVIVIMVNNIVIHKIPVAHTTLLIFIGQLAAGTFIDYFQLGIFTRGKVIGAILVLIGLIIDKTQSKETASKV